MSPGKLFHAHFDRHLDVLRIVLSLSVFDDIKQQRATSCNMWHYIKIDKDEYFLFSIAISEMYPNRGTDI